MMKYLPLAVSIISARAEDPVPVEPVPATTEAPVDEVIDGQMFGLARSLFMPMFGGLGGGMYGNNMNYMGGGYGNSMGAFNRGNSFSNRSAWDRGYNNTDAMNFNNGMYGNSGGNFLGSNMGNYGGFYRRLEGIDELPAEFTTTPDDSTTTELPPGEDEEIDGQTYWRRYRYGYPGYRAYGGYPMGYYGGYGGMSYPMMGGYMGVGYRPYYGGMYRRLLAVDELPELPNYEDAADETPGEEIDGQTYGMYGGMMNPMMAGGMMNGGMAGGMMNPMMAGRMAGGMMNPMMAGGMMNPMMGGGIMNPMMGGGMMGGAQGSQLNSANNGFLNANGAHNTGSSYSNRSGWDKGYSNTDSNSYNSGMNNMNQGNNQYLNNGMNSAYY